MFTDHQSAALAAFVECVVGHLNPSLRAFTKPANGGCEYEIVIGGTGRGILHEQIEEVLRIATKHGAHAFISHTHDEDVYDRPLCLIWPDKKVPGPK